MANWEPARIPPQTPPAGGNSAEAKRKILSPRKKDFRFAESVLKPHALLEYLEGRTPKEKHPFLFQKKFHPRQNRNARSVFSFGVAGVLASAWASFVQFPLEKGSRKVYNYSTDEHSEAVAGSCAPAHTAGGTRTLHSQYRFPIFSNDYIFKNKGEPFRALPNT